MKPLTALPSLPKQAISHERHDLHQQYKHQELCAQQLQKLTAKQIQACYSMTQVKLNQASHKQVSHFQLIRKHPNKLAYHYPQAGLTELWLHQKRHSSLFKTSEQGQTFIIHGLRKNIEQQTLSEQWSKLHHVINPKLLTQLSTGSIYGEGCIQTRSYSGMLHGEFIQVNWLCHFELPLSIHWATPQEFRQYNLEQVLAIPTRFFETLEQYQKTSLSLKNKPVATLISKNISMK